MIRSFSLISLLSIISFLSLGQVSNGEENMLLELEIDNAINGGNLNQAQVVQFGNDNSSNIGQEGGSFRLPNVATSVQHGLSNEVFISQQGVGNVSTAVQIGKRNSYDLSLEGDDNTTNLFQFGTENSVEQMLEGDNRRYLVIQKGSNNELIQKEYNPQLSGYEVYQVGNGINITIENTSLY
ncbi:MAG: hypothetical protein RIC15_07995 [Vicingaceae bacterium]